MHSASLLSLAPPAKRPRTEAYSAFDAHVVSRLNPAVTSKGATQASATGVAYPTSLADVKRQLAEAKAIRAAAVEKEDAERKAVRQKKLEKEAALKTAVVGASSWGTSVRSCSK